jgi:hypothetical protein
MTQTQPDRLGQLEFPIERVDRKLETIATDIVGIKVLLAKTDERLNSLDTQVSDLKKPKYIAMKYRRARVTGGTYFFTVVTHHRRQFLHPEISVCSGDSQMEIALFWFLNFL